MDRLILRVSKNGMPEGTLDNIIGRMQQQNATVVRVTDSHFDNLPDYYLTFSPLDAIAFGQVQGFIQHGLGVDCGQVSIEQVNETVNAAYVGRRSSARNALADLLMLQLSAPGPLETEDPVLYKARVEATAAAYTRVGAGR